MQNLSELNIEEWKIQFQRVDLPEAIQHYLNTSSIPDLKTQAVQLAHSYLVKDKPVSTLQLIASFGNPNQYHSYLPQHEEHVPDEHSKITYMKSIDYAVSANNYPLLNCFISRQTLWMSTAHASFLMDLVAVAKINQAHECETAILHSIPDEDKRAKLSNWVNTFYNSMLHPEQIPEEQKSSFTMS